MKDFLVMLAKIALGLVIVGLIMAYGTRATTLNTDAMSSIPTTVSGFSK